ncbi:MAG: MBL fold metallo-hydrolase [Clostridia bacterium]|nr:MBL fold metallo-hydrolase [Clostridia bacterium]
MKISRFIVGSLGTNCYLVSCDDGCDAVLIDPGAEAERILASASAKHLNIKAVALTHGHFDHIMAVNEVIAATGAELFVHRDDSEMIRNPELNVSARFREPYAVDAEIKKELCDGDVISVGSLELTVIHTPGHTPGSVCFVCGDTIFTGDTVFRGGIGRYDLPGGDYNLLMKSVEKLNRLNGDYRLLPGHDSPSTLSYERETSIYFN